MLAEVADAAPSADEQIDRHRAREVLETVLLDLPMDLRTVFVLCELEELTVPTLAALLDIPVGTAASRLRRARESFHAAVRRHQVQSLRTRRMMR